MSDFDATWFCLVCEREILPKRRVVKVPIPPAPPSSPSDSSSDSSRKSTKRSGGLVRGTGRVNINGSIKRTQQMKLKTVIDQGPLPLYCSDECQMKDLDSGNLPLNYNPNRHSMSQLPVHKESPSMATLCKLYNFPPLPPPQIIATEEAPPQPQEFTSGIMMAHKFIEEMAEQNKPPPQSNSRYPDPVPPQKIIPGWNDGSNAWRATVYSFSSSSESVSSAPCHRSDYTSCSAPTSRPITGSDDRDLLMSKYSAAFNRRAESAPSCTSSSLPKRERPLLAEGAKLLVPDVKLKVRSGSSTSISSMSPRGSRPSVRSPLSINSDLGDEIEEDLSSPTEELHFRKDRSGSSSSTKSKRPVSECKHLALYSHLEF